MTTDEEASMPTMQRSDPEPLRFQMPPFDPSRASRPSAFVGIPETFLVLIGHAVASWSMFERDFDRLVFALLSQNATSDEGDWQLRSFRKRAGLLLQEFDKFMPHKNSPSRRFVAGLCNDGLRLFLTRNVLVHGKIFVKVETHEVVNGKLEGLLALHCIGVFRGRLVVRDFTEADLQNLRYELAHLCGRVNAFVRSPTTALTPSSQDIPFLQALSGTLQSLPREPTDLPQPGALPE